MSNTLGSFVHFTLVRLLGQAALFMFPLVVAAFLSPEDFGRFSLAMMVLFVFTAVGIQSSHKPYIVQASAEFDASGKTSVTIASRSVLTLVVFVLALVLAFVFKDLLLAFSDLRSEQFRWVIAAFFVFSFRFIYVGIFVTTGVKFRAPLLELTIGLAQLAVLGLFYWLFELDLDSVIATVFLGYSVAVLCALPMLPWRKLLPLRFERKATIQLFRNSLWYMLGGVAVYLINWGDNLVLRLYMDLEQIGYYNFGYQVFKGLLICFATITLFYLPNVQQFLVDKEQLRHYLFRTRLQILGLGVLGLVAVGILLAPALQLVYGDKYNASLPVIYCLLIASLFSLYYILQLTLVEGMARFKFVQLANFLAVAINLGLDFLLIPQLGILGAAIATTVAYAALAGVFHWYVAKNLEW